MSDDPTVCLRFVSCACDIADRCYLTWPRARKEIFYSV